MPRLNKKTGRLEASWAEVEQVRSIGLLIIRVLETLNLTETKRDKDGSLKAFTNLTLLNLWVLKMGGEQGIREDVASYGLIGLQLASGALGLFVRHSLALLVFWEDNLGSWVPI